MRNWKITQGEEREGEREGKHSKASKIKERHGNKCSHTLPEK